MDNNKIEAKPFGMLNSAFVGLLIALFSGVFFHFIFERSELLEQMEMTYLPYLMAIFVGTTVAALCSKIRVPGNEET